jgi:hypothetical protein
MRDLTRVFESVDQSHDCEERNRHRGQERSTNESSAPEELYGAAITKIDQRDGQWWAHNGEYSTEISFCPWCGIRLSPDAKSPGDLPATK